MKNPTKTIGIIALIGIIGVAIWQLFKTKSETKAPAAVTTSTAASTAPAASSTLHTNTVISQTYMPYSGKKAVILGDTTASEWDFDKLINHTGLKSVTNLFDNGSKISSGADSFIARKASVATENPDLIIVWGGTFDFQADLAIGTDADTTVVTFKGAVDKLINDLLADHPDKPIIFMTPIQRDKPTVTVVEGEDVLTYDGNGPTPNNRFLMQYADAIISKCGQYGIPVLDLYRKSGINLVNHESFLEDGLTPSEEGYDKISNLLAGYLNSAATA